MGKKVQRFLPARPVAIPTAPAVPRSKVNGSLIPTRQTIYQGVNGSVAEANQWSNSMKSKSNGCGHKEEKEYGKGKKGKGYVEIEIKMGRMPKKKAKRK